METPPTESPDIFELERLVDENWNERKRLIDREWELRTELQSVIRRGMDAAKFEEVRARERESRAALSRNLDQYDDLIENWAERVVKD
jgi:hypothetical protein